MMNQRNPEPSQDALNRCSSTDADGYESVAPATSDEVYPPVIETPSTNHAVTIDEPAVSVCHERNDRLDAVEGAPMGEIGDKDEEEPSQHSEDVETLYS